MGAVIKHLDFYRITQLTLVRTENDIIDFLALRVSLASVGTHDQIQVFQELNLAGRAE